METRRNNGIYATFWLVIALIAFLLVSPPEESEETKRDLEEICMEGVLRVATDTAATVEFQSELLCALADSLQLEVEEVEINSLAEAINGLDERSLDLIALHIPVTSELRKRLAFTENIGKNKAVLVQRTARANNRKKPLRNQLDLAKKTLHLPAHSPFMLRLRNLSREIGDSIYVKHIPDTQTEQLIRLVARGEIEFAIADEGTARRMQEDFPETDIRTAIGFTYPEAWAVRKSSPELLKVINYKMIECIK
jgi:membrane-bound lytic murein transglycosylase MltF